MRVERKDIRGNFEHHMIAAVILLRFRDHRLERRLVRHAVVGRDHCPIGDREDVLSEGIVLLDLLAVAVINLVVLDPGPVDGEGFTSLDAAAVYGDSKISVDVRLAATAAREPAVPPKGWLDHDGRAAVDRDFRAVNLEAADH
jgi:hypothetical protein